MPTLRRCSLPSKIAVNGSDGKYCGFDTGRIDGLIDVLEPVFEARGIEAADGLSNETIVTNEFCGEAPAL